MGIKYRIEFFMGKEGINANELAIRMGVTPSTIYSMLKRDSSRIDIDLLIKIAKALNVTTDELLGADLPQKPTTIAAHFDGDEFTPEEQEELLNYAQFLKSKRS